MTLSELQQAVDQFDRERGWHRVDPAHIGLHLLEELGEIARELLRRAAYKDGDGDIAQEMSDLLTALLRRSWGSCRRPLRPEGAR